MIDSLLRRIDWNLVLRWRIWKSKWFPYRTVGLEDLRKEWEGGPKAKYQWNRPTKWQ